MPRTASCLLIWVLPPQITAKAGDKFLIFKVANENGCLFEFSLPDPTFLDVDFLDLTCCCNLTGFFEFLSCENNLAFFTIFLEAFFLAATVDGGASDEATIGVVDNDPALDFDFSFCLGSGFFILTIFSSSSCNFEKKNIVLKRSRI